ncbi:MAG: hypothetical protein MUF73_04435 [Rhodobacteraceae bacterium]|nr:hypothetical protein [Paracoccaceae bacterium]
MLAGPGAPGLVASTDVIQTLGQMSIAVLVFLVGLRLAVSLVRAPGKVALADGLDRAVVRGARDRRAGVAPCGGGAHVLALVHQNHRQAVV